MLSELDVLEPTSLGVDEFQRIDQLGQHVIQFADDASVQARIGWLAGASAGGDLTEQPVELHAEGVARIVGHGDCLTNPVDKGDQFGSADCRIIGEGATGRRGCALQKGIVHRSIPLVGETKTGGVLERGWAHPAGSFRRCCRAGVGHAALDFWGFRSDDFKYATASADSGSSVAGRSSTSGLRHGGIDPFVFQECTVWTGRPVERAITVAPPTALKM